MKTLLLLLFLTGSNLYPAKPEPGRATDDKVYICVGGSGYAYHKTRKCHWLQNCTHTIKEVTLTEAKEEYRKRPCKPCYGQ